MNNYSVLFVDDEVNILTSLKRGLMDEEYNCYFAASGKAALEIMKKKEIAVIVSDMKMPEMDGLTLLKEVKDKYPRTVRIVLSGYTQLQQVLVTINSAEIFKFITKPWKLEEEFKVVIKQALNYYRIQEENEETKKALSSKNLAYQNMFKNIHNIIETSKRFSDMLAICCRQILYFNRAISKAKSNDLYTFFQPFEEKVLDLFAMAVKSTEIEENDYPSEELIQEFLKLVQSEVRIKEFDDQHTSSEKIKCNIFMLEAIILSTIIVLKDEYLKYSLVVQIGEVQDSKLSILMISPNAYNTHVKNQDTNASILDLKIYFLNSVITTISEMLKINYKLTKSNGSVVTLITLN